MVGTFAFLFWCWMVGLDGLPYSFMISLPV